jgi:uncharacterized protein YprB with RNaseH-like and TPR domain
MPPLEDHFARLRALRPAPRRAATAPRGVPVRLAESDRLAGLVGAACERNRYGEYLVVRRWFAEPACFDAHAEALRMLAPKSLPATLDEIGDPGHWLFLDTETTGLAGGTGTYAFLVGVAWWDAGGLQVEQFFMRDHSEEHAVLVALAERLKERRVLVSFNGKSFDWPLLDTRYRMTRSIAPVAPRAHLDLLHPARQLWRLRLSSVRLTELERHVLGWQRGTDVAAELIPQIYFEFLRGGPSEPLALVFRHNQMDLRGLAALAGRMAELLAEPEAAPNDPLDLFGLARLFQRRGELPRARRLSERALHLGLPKEIDRAARRQLARLAKRERDFARATALWAELLADSSGEVEARLDAFEQLAIYYEHHARAFDRAAELTRKALAVLHRALQVGQLELGRLRRWQARFQHRLARLERHTTSLKASFLAPAQK